MEDILNLYDLSDLPKTIKDSIERPDEFQARIMKIFLKFPDKELSIDQVTVAHYRMFKREKTRTQIMNKMYQIMRFKGLLVSTDRKGCYRLNKENVK